MSLTNRYDWNNPKEINNVKLLEVFIKESLSNKIQIWRILLDDRQKAIKRLWLKKKKEKAQRKTAKLYEWYENEIINELQLDREILNKYFNFINEYCEFDLVLEAIIACNEIATHRKKGRNVHREKKQFEKKIKAIKEQCKEIGLNFEEPKYENRTKFFYEDLLKEKKRIFKNLLINDCKTGKVRANEIIKILEEI